MSSPPLPLSALFLAAAASHIALSPPSPELTLWEAQSMKDLGVERMVSVSRWVKTTMWACKSIIWFSTACETVLYLVHSDPFSPLSRTLLFRLPEGLTNLSRGPDTAGLSLPMSCGFILITVGAILHISSRGTLGTLAYAPITVQTHAPNRPLYVPRSQLLVPASNALEKHATNARDDANRTVRWTLRPAHRLVQRGPYRFVRHPMYAGALFALVGSAFIFLTPRSIVHALTATTCLMEPVLPSSFHAPFPSAWIDTDSAWDVDKVTWAGAAAFVFGFAVLGTVLGLVRMARREDEALQERFGKQWTLYRWSVRSMFLPGLF